MKLLDKQHVICKRIIQEVGEYYAVDLKKDTRKRKIVLPRQVAMYFCRKQTKKPFESVGSYFPSSKSRSGHRDSATVIHACGVIESLLSYDKKFQKQIKELDDIISPFTFETKEEMEIYEIKNSILNFLNLLNLEQLMELKTKSLL